MIISKNNRIYYFFAFTIIIISPLQSIAGHRPFQFLVISLAFRLLASSSCLYQNPAFTKVMNYKLRPFRFVTHTYDAHMLT
jgi:hypothetical protein